MKRWPTKPLEQIAELFGGSTPTRNKPAYWNGDIPWVTPTDLPMPDEGISVVDETKDKITKVGLENSGTNIVPKGTVLFSSRATIGKVAVADMPLTTNQGFANFVPGPEITSQFLAYSLWHRRDDIARLSGSTTFKEVSRSTLRKYEIPVPPLAEQERLVKLLDEADALRKLRAQADRRTADFIPALFHQMFGDPVKNSRKLRRQAFGELLDRIDSGWSPTCQDRPAQFNEWGVLKLGAVTTCKYLDTETKAMLEEIAPRPELEIKAGDLLFTRKNTYELVAACAFVFETAPKLMLSDLIFRFRLKADAQLDPIFLWGLLTEHNKRKQVQAMAGGSAGSMPNISKGRLITLPIELPPLPLQKAFAERVKEIRGLETAQARSRARLDALFASLLDRAFKGEL